MEKENSALHRSLTTSKTCMSYNSFVWKATIKCINVQHRRYCSNKTSHIYQLHQWQCSIQHKKRTCKRKVRKLECKARPDQRPAERSRLQKIRMTKRWLQLLLCNSNQQLHGINGITTSSSFWLITKPTLT